MGSASSKPTAGPAPGPELTSSEKLSAAQFAETESLDEWLKRLNERSNPTRLNLAHILSVTVHESEDTGTNFDYLGDQLLAVCGNSRERVQRLLQTRFLNGETVITWTICHLPMQVILRTPLEEIPPVLAVQLRLLRPWKANTELTEAMAVACCTRNANSLYQLLNPYRRPKALMAESHVYSITSPSPTSKSFDFTINDFPTLMIGDGRIDMRFICESRLYSLGFLIDAKGRWSFFYNVVYDQSTTKVYDREIHVDLETFNGATERFSVYKVKVSSRSWSKGEWIGGDASILKNANQFVGRDRVLKGHIRIKDC